MSALEDSIREIVRAEMDSRLAVAPPPADSQASETAAKLARVMAKEFISISEAELLLSCTNYQMRKMLKQAAEGKSANPIPARDLDGVATVFSLKELLEWSRGKKGKTRLRDVSAR